MLLSISSPGAPFIKLAKISSEAVRGGMVTLTCTDSGGVPPPNLSNGESNLENSPCQSLQHGDKNLMIITMSGTDLQKITVQVACKWRV